MPEQDERLRLLNTLLTTPHRDLSAIYPVHKTIIESDPRFYVRLAAWYADKGEVRDHREMFVVCLCLSDFDGHRGAGLALLRKLPPHQVARVVDFIKGKNPRPKKEKTAAAPAVPEAPTSSIVQNALSGLSRRQRRTNQNTAPRPSAAQRRATASQETQRTGLGKNLPRSMKTEIERYLREREADAARFDSAVLHARASLKRLYAGLHIAPGERAQKILFEDAPPQDSSLGAIKAIAAASTPAEQARAIATHKIPYRVAVSVIKQMTPTTLAALIHVMTPAEVINNIGSLKKRGAFDNKDIKKLIEEKVTLAQSDTRVSAYKAKVAIAASGAGEELAQQLHEVTEVQIKSKGTIKRPTALLLDKSASMTVALEVGKQLGAMISAVCEAELFAYAFDTTAYALEVKSEKLADWEKALAGITAGNATSCGVAIEWMRRKNQRVEQIVMVTDEGENQGPRFKTAYESYVQQMNMRPDVVFVKVGTASNQLEADCAEMGVMYSAWDFRGDYYALPNLLPLLARPSMLELLMEIMEYPLPARAA